MPVPTEFRIAPQWFSAVQLTAAYAFTAFPEQAGQGRFRWIPPLNESDVLAEGAEVRTGLDGAAAFIGARNGSIALYLPTAAQVAYVRSYLFAGKASARCTYSYLDRATNTWHCDWIVLNAPLFVDSWQRAAGGTRLYQMPFVVRRAAPSGPTLSLAITPSTETPTTSSPLDYVLEVFNSGDFETFDDLVVLIALPLNTRWELADVTAVSFNIEYSTNNGGSYSSTPPVPLSDTTHLRLTRTTALDANDVATITLAGDVVDVGQLLLTVQASTTGAAPVMDDSDLTAV